MQFALVAKLIINMHDLNNERAEEIRRIPLLYQTNQGFEFVGEAVAVSGVMLKHWHARYLTEVAKRYNVPLCPLCERGESIRLPPSDAITADWLHMSEMEKKNYLEMIEGEEEKIIRGCVGEDVHGFLRTKPEPMLRREALVKFSWLLPVDIPEVRDNVGTSTPFTILQHTRNIREVPKEPRELKQMQMPYPRGYANGVYGFTSIADLKRVGFAFTCRKYVLNDSDINNRRKAVIEAYVPLITGLGGASLARALPASKPLEVITIVSREAKSSFPAPVHPIFNDYFDLTKDMFKDFSKLFDVDVSIYAYGVGKNEEVDKLKVEVVDNPLAVFTKALKTLFEPEEGR